ncbi:MULTISPECIES: 3'-5' exonuclease [Aphanothece]|uniref:3'-5' exonuclease n=1 Tax=Aphanothece TaxID=1121 RepID=UPI0039854872
MLLFFDTETTGLPRSRHAPASDLANWPRIVQIAWLLTDHQGHRKQTVEAIIRPDGFAIPADAARVHGITTARAMAEGQPLPDVLQRLLADLRRADTLIAHNLAFDEKVLGAELLRCGLPNPLPSLSRNCTMEASTELCQLPGSFGPKWPSLEELHQHLFGSGIDGAHHALVDVEATARCFFELRRRGVIA